MKKLILIGAFLLTFITTYANEVVWAGGTSTSWHIGANWQGGNVPNGSDTAVFNSSSSVNAVISSNISVGGIRIESGYTGTITQSSGTITVASFGFIQSGGTFVGGSENISISGYFTLNNGVFVATSGALTLSGYEVSVTGGTFTHSSGTIYKTGGSAIWNFNQSINNLVINTQGNFTTTSLHVLGNVDALGWNVHNGTMEVEGNYKTYFISQSTSLGKVVFTGSNNQLLDTNNGSGCISGVEVNKTGGTLTVHDTILVRTDWTNISSGANVDVSEAEIKFIYENDITSNGMVFGDVTVSCPGWFNAVDTMRIAGLAKFSGFNSVNGLMEVSGNVLMTAQTQSVSTAVLKFVGSENQTLGANGTSGVFANILIQKSGGTLTISDTIKLSLGLKWISGMVNASNSNFIFYGGSQTIEAEGINFNNVEFNTGGNISLLRPLKVDGNLTISSINWLEPERVEVKGNLTITDTFFWGSGVETYLVGSNNQIINIAGNSGLRKSLFINKTGGVVSLGANLNLDFGWQNINIINGTLDLNGFNLSLGGVLKNSGLIKLIGSETVSLGSLDSSGQGTVTYYGTGTYSTLALGDSYYHLNVTGNSTQDSQLSVLGNLNISGTLNSAGYNLFVGGDFNNSGTYTSGANSVYFIGKHQTIYGSNSFNNLIKRNNTSASITFPAGTTQTISGVLELNGTVGDLLVLKSSTPGTVWNINHTGSINRLSYLNVSDSTSVSTLDAKSNSTNGGNNTNWEFNSVNALVWTGAINNNFSNAGNWGGNIAPTANDIVEFLSGSSAVSIDIDANVAGIVLGSGFGGSVTLAANKTLSVGYSGITISGGTFNGNTKKITVSGDLAVNNGYFNSIASDVEIVGSVQLTGGTLKSSTYSFKVGGSWTKSGGIFDALGTVNFNGYGGQSITAGGTDANSDFASIDVSFGTVTIASALKVNGNLTVNSGQLKSNANILLGGNLNNNGGYINDQTNAVWVLNGTVAQTVKLQNHKLKNIQVSNTANKVTFLDEMNANELIGDAGANIFIEKGKFLELTKLTLNGTATQPIGFKSTIAQQNARVVVIGLQTLSYVDVRGIDGQFGPTLDGSNHCVDLGYNINWVFPDNSGKPVVTFNPESDVFENSVAVSLSSTGTAPIIYYTLDGSTPTTSSTVYSAPLNLSATTTIKAISVDGASTSIVFSKVYTATQSAIDDGLVYPVKSYGLNAIVYLGDVRRFEGQAFHVGADGIMNTSDDYRVPEFDKYIAWSCTQGTIEKIAGTGGAVFTGNGSSNYYTITLTLGPKSFTGCNNSMPVTESGHGEPMFGIPDNSNNPMPSPIEDYAHHCLSENSPTILPTKGKSVILNVVRKAGFYNLVPFSLGRASRMSGFNEIRVISSTRVLLLNINSRNAGWFPYDLNSTGNFYRVGGDAGYIEKIIESNVVVGYRYHAPDGTVWEFRKIIGTNNFRITKVIDPFENTIVYDYISNNYMVITDASGSIYEVYADTVIGGVNQISKIIIRPFGSTLYRTWYYSYDVNGFLISELFEDLNNPANGCEYKFVSDIHGNPTMYQNCNGCQSFITYDDAWRVTGYYNANGEYITNYYSGKNGAYYVRITNSNGQVAYIYRNQTPYRMVTTKYINYLGLITDYFYNSYSYISQWRYQQTYNGPYYYHNYLYDIWYYLMQDNFDPTGLNQTTNYQWDAHGNLLLQINPDGNSNYVYTYSTQNAVLSTTFNASGQNYSTTRTYNSAGQLIEEIDEFGVKTSYVYDSVGNLIHEEKEQVYSFNYAYGIWGHRIGTDSNGNTTTFERNITKANAWDISQYIQNGNLRIANLRNLGGWDAWYKFTIAAPAANNTFVDYYMKPNPLFVELYHFDLSLENAAGTVLSVNDHQVYWNLVTHQFEDHSSNLNLNLQSGTYYLKVHDSSDRWSTYNLNSQFTFTGNQPPIANSQSASTNEDTAKNITLTGQDPETQTLTYAIVTGPQHGSLSGSGSAKVYTPAANYNGSDSFTFTVSDGVNTSNIATVSFTISPVNDAPVAVANSVTTDEDTILTFNPVTNDTDADLDSLSITAITSGTKGSASFSGNTVTYTPNQNANGNDSITYTITDGHGGSSTGTISITINAINDAPVANSDSISTAEEAAITFNPVTNDTDIENNTLTIIAKTNGSKGTVTYVGNNVTYTPILKATGSDSFTYTISDGNGGSSVGSVTVTITPINDAPVAVADSVSTNEDTALAFNPVTNDTDVDLDSLSITAVTSGTKGNASFSGNTITYTPNLNANGNDSITYTITDGHGGSSTGTVSITINAVNDAPIAVNDSFSATPNVPVFVNVLSNDSDVDLNPLVITAVGTPSHGTAVIQSNQIKYTANDGYAGSDSYSYTISDGQLTATATASVTVGATLPSVALDAPGGDYNNFKYLTFSSHNFGSGDITVYYTLDGTTPTTSSPNHVNASDEFKFLLNVDATVKAFANNGTVSSEIITETYTFHKVQIERQVSKIVLVANVLQPELSANLPCYQDYNNLFPIEFYNDNGHDKFDTNPLVTRMNTIVVNIGGIYEAGNLIITKGATPTVIYSKEVIANETIENVQLDLLDYGELKVFIDNSNISLINKNLYPLVIDRNNDYSETGALNSDFTGIAKCEENFSTELFEWLVNLTSESTGELQFQTEMLIDTDNNDSWVSNLGSFSGSWNNSTPVALPIVGPSYSISRYGFDLAGNVKLLMETTRTAPPIPPTSIEASWSANENGYIIDAKVIEPTNTLALMPPWVNNDPEYTLHLEGISPCTFSGIYSGLLFDLDLINSSSTPRVIDTSEVEDIGLGYTAFDFIYYYAEPCKNTEQGKDPGTAGLDAVLALGCTVTTSFTDKNSDGVKLFDATKLKLRERPELTPTILGNEATFNLGTNLKLDNGNLMGMTYNVDINNDALKVFPFGGDNTCATNPSTKSGTLTAGLVKNLTFASCGIKFETSVVGTDTSSNTIEVTVLTPPFISLDVLGTNYTYRQEQNATIIKVSKDNEAFNFSFSMKGGEKLTNLDAVCVTINVAGCQNHQTAVYNPQTCSCKTNFNSPRFSAPVTEDCVVRVTPSTLASGGPGNAPIEDKGHPIQLILKNGDGLVTGVIYEGGGALIFEYNQTDKTVLETNEDGTQVLFQYDPSFTFVTQKTIVGGAKGYSYTYNSNGDITQITTLNNNVPQSSQVFEYNGNNQVTKRTDADGTFERWVYGPSTITHIDKFGNQTVNTYDSGNRLISTAAPTGTVVYTYESIPNNNSFSLDLDLFNDTGNLYTEFAGNYFKFSGGGYAYNYVKYAFDEDMQLITYGVSSTGIYKNDVKVFDFISSQNPAYPFEFATYETVQTGDTVYANSHIEKIIRLTKITHYNPEGGIIKQVTQWYNDDVVLVTRESRLSANLNETPYYKEFINTNGDVTSISYLRDGVVINQPSSSYVYNSEGLVESVTAPDGGVTLYTYYNTKLLEGLVQSETDPLDNTIFYEYDEKRRVTKVYGNTSRPGVSTYTNAGHLLTFECKQYYPETQSFGPTHYKEIYTYLGTLLLTKTIQNATATESVTESYTYDFLGRKASHTDANGIVTKYEYNNMDNITQEIRDFGVAPHLNITTTYSYNSLGLLEEINFEGHITKNIFDSFGRTTSVVQDPLGLNITQVSNTFDSQWRQHTMTDAMGNTTTYNFNQLGQQYQTINALGVVSESVFDGAGNVIRRIEDAGVGKLNATTEFFFDNQGRQFKTISAVGQPYQREDRVEFDLNGNTVKQIEDYTGLARVTTMEFDGLGNQIITTLDPDAPSHTGLKIINQSNFNEIGQMVSSTAPNGLVTEYHYNYLGRQTSTVVDPTGLAITSSAIFDNNGNVTQTTDAGGLVTTMVYDTLSRLGTQTVDPGGKNIVSKSFYNRDGSIDKTINPEGVVTKNIYNSIGQRTSTIVDEGVTNIATQFEYNLVGNITTIIDPLTKTATRGYDALHRSIASTDAKGNISRVVYDNLNRPIISIDALGVQTVTNYNLLNQVTSQEFDPTGLNQTTSMLYDSLGRATTITKANGVQEVFEYDLADRKTKATEDPTGLNIITQYEFNSLGQMTKVIDAKNKATQYAYNSLGQLTTETYADAGVKSYTYNSIGQRITQVDQNNNQFGYLYDNLYRLTTVNVTPGAGVGGTTQQVFTYDNMSRLTNAKDIAGSTNEVARVYNTLGRLASETQKIGATEKTVSTQYNLVGRVTQLTYPDGRVNSYTFDNNHLPYTTTSNSTVVATYQYNAVNAPVTKTLGNNVSLYIEYNNRYQITKHDWKLNGNTITGFNYGHDSVSNRIWSENLVTANKSEHFAFDNADRLTSFKIGTLNGAKDNIVTPTYSQSWNLDSIGNWAGFTDNGTNSTNTFSDTHEMTQFKGVTNTFDNNGNLTSDGVRTYKYDAFNRIIEVKVGAVVLAEYQYDAFNRRVLKQVDADLNSSFETTVKFLYDGFRCIEELNASDALTKEYVYGSLYIDEVILQKTGATDYYFTHDNRYSVTSLTNSAGNMVESYDYKVYGERTCSGSGLTEVGYTGQRHDSETGLMYFKNRYYSVLMGSFVSRDPLGYVNGLSMYLGYFGGNGADPFGLESWGIDDEACSVTLYLRINFVFKGKWTERQKLDYIWDAKTVIHDDWNDKFKLVPSNKKWTNKSNNKECDCPCQNGYRIRVNIDSSTTEYKTSGGIHDYTFIVYDSKGRAYASLGNYGSTTENAVGGGQGALYIDSNFTQSGRPVYTEQTTISHEFGHVLGLGHPGDTWYDNSSQSAYNTDDGYSTSGYGKGRGGWMDNDIMGNGTRIRGNYVRKWENIINKNRSECGPFNLFDMQLNPTENYIRGIPTQYRQYESKRK